MLLKRKVKQKKVVVKQMEWLEKPVDAVAQEKQDKEVTFTARFSEKEKKGKWYFRNEVIKHFTSCYYKMERHVRKYIYVLLKS